MMSSSSTESCAACGTDSAGLKACAACKLVKYCSVDCQVAHRSTHKTLCKKKARELFDARLFAQPPRREDCPICFLILPLPDECAYLACCGKFICIGCRYCLTRFTCPFCNTPSPANQQQLNRQLFERIDKYNDPQAMNQVGGYYNMGKMGFSLDQRKAVELFQRASELGLASAHFNLGTSYQSGGGVEQDRKKAIHHWQQAAMMGYEDARYNLGCMETESRNMGNSMRHHIISAKCGHDDSLKEVKMGFRAGIVTKDDFADTLRCHQASQDETKSEQRDRARATRGY